MDVLKEYKELELNIEFKKFLRDNKDYYLVHALIPENKERTEFGFFNSKTDKITIFKTNPVEKGEEDDVFKEGKTIEPISLEKVKINYEEAIEKTNQILRKEYSAEEPNKKIIILQRISEIVWNMTFICKSLNIINIRIDAETGEIKRKDKTSLMNMAGMMK